MNLQKIMTGGVAASALVMASALPAMAASTVVVTPAHTQGWSTADTRPGGAVNFIADSTAPGGAALQLTTNATTTAKAQYLHDTNTLLSDITELSYQTKQNSASFVGGDPSYQLPALLNGNAGGFTTLVFEPYQNPTQGPVIPGQWQSWNVANGLFWSSRTVTCSNGTIVGTPGGPATYTLSQIESTCPEATAIQFGVNIGSNNPSYDIETDLVNFNGTTYDFQLTNEPTSKDACKDNGYQNLTDAQGNAFPNQGQCVSYFNHL